MHGRHVLLPVAHEHLDKPRRDRVEDLAVLAGDRLKLARRHDRMVIGDLVVIKHAPWLATRPALTLGGGRDILLQQLQRRRIPMPELA